MNKGLFLSFWTKSSGNALTHAGGLTAEQVQALKDLKVGDRLILFKNDGRGGEKAPAFTMKVFNPPDKGGTDGI